MQVDTHGIIPKVRRTCSLGRRKIPLGGNGWDSRLTTISERKSMPVHFLAEVAIIVLHFPGLFSYDPCHNHC